MYAHASVLMCVTAYHHVYYTNFIAVIEGEFVTGYLNSIGNLNFAGGVNGVINRFLMDLRSSITDDDITNQNDTFIQLVDGVLKSIENAAIANLNGRSNQADASACVRQVIEVQTISLSLSL